MEHSEFALLGETTTTLKNSYEPEVLYFPHMKMLNLFLKQYYEGEKKGIFEVFSGQSRKTIDMENLIVLFHPIQALPIPAEGDEYFTLRVKLKDYGEFSFIIWGSRRSLRVYEKFKTLIRVPPTNKIIEFIQGRFRNGYYRHIAEITQLELISKEDMGESNNESN